MDQYCCDVYYILETRAYRISGSTELFPQHCQLPDMSPHQHLCALTNELSKLAPPANATPKGKCLLPLQQTCLHALLNSPPVSRAEQRVDEPINAHVAQQRVINVAPIITIPRITEAPGIMKLRNPAAKRTLKTMPRLHCRVTRNNTLGIMPVPTVGPIVPQPAAVQTYQPILLGAHSRIITQHATNALTATEIKKYQDIFAPHILSTAAPSRAAIQPEHFAYPMVHPVTGKTISSYKKLMNDPATAETWQTALGKDFGGMSQGGNKTGQKGTNAMFVMTHDTIRHVLATRQKITYGNLVVNY
jgi:hypothetical protein